LIIKNNFEEINNYKNPNEFDYKQYHGFKNIYHRVYLLQTEWKKISAESFTIYGMANGLQNRFHDIIKKYVHSKQAQAIVAALVLGYRQDLDNDLIQLYATTDAMHILAVSGLHVGIIYLLLNTLLGFLNRKKWGKTLRLFLLLFAIWLYAVITGLSPSILRASTMFSFIIIGQLLYKQPNTYNFLAASAFFLLCFDPFILMDIGFQLSYVAVVGIVYLQPRIYNLLDIDMLILDKGWAITSIAIAAKITIFPLLLLYFHRFSVYFIITNLILIPVASIIIPLGIILLCFSSLEPIAHFVGQLLENIVEMLNGFLRFFSNMPYASIGDISITIYETFFIYLLIIGIIAFVVSRQLNYLRYTLILSILLAIFNLVEQYQHIHQRYFIVYNIPKASGYDFITGKRSHLLSRENSSGSIISQKKIDHFIKPNWIKLGITTIKSSSFGEFSNFPYGAFYDKRIVFLQQRSILPSSKNKLTIDYVVLSNKSGVSIKEIVKRYNFKLLIIDSSFKKQAAMQLLQEAKKFNIPCHIVSEDGAFSVDY